MNTLIQSIPTGGSSVYTLAYRHVFTDTQSARVAVQASAFIDASLTRDAANSTDVTQLRPGVLMGKITASGKYREAIIGKTTAAALANATSLTVAAATATELQRLITAAGQAITVNIVAPPTASGTVAILPVAISAASGTTATISTSGGISAAAVSGALIMPSDGAGTPITVVPDGYGIPLCDASGASQDQVLSPFYVKGDIDVNQIVNYPSDSSLKTWLKGQLRTSGDFTFNDDR